MNKFSNHQQKMLSSITDNQMKLHFIRSLESHQVEFVTDEFSYSQLIDSFEDSLMISKDRREIEA